jgi:tRNA-splicing ligase RtcB
MSRTKAKATQRWSDAQHELDRQHVTVLSAGLDEVPAVYKDIHKVMEAQKDLVDVCATFQPRIVKMDGKSR